MNTNSDLVWRDNLLTSSRDIIPGIFISHCRELRSHMHDRKGQWNGLSVEENHRKHLFLCQKVFSGINVLLSMIYNEKGCAGRLGLLSLHYTRAGSTPVLCPRSLPLPAPTWNNELQRMPWGLSGFNSGVDSILAQITSQIAFKWKFLWLVPCLGWNNLLFFNEFSLTLAFSCGHIYMCLKTSASLLRTGFCSASCALPVDSSSSSVVETTDQTSGDAALCTPSKQICPRVN